MNNYVLVLKFKDSDYFIDMASDNLEVVGKRMEDIGNSEFSKIFTLSDLSSGKMYINDKIEEISKSMERFEFYQIYRIESFIKGIDKLSISTHVIATNESEISEIEESYESVVSSWFIKMIGKAGNIDKLGINLLKDLTKEDIDTKIEFIGMDTWIPDPMGVYYTNSINLTDSMLFESFMDYMERHSNSTEMNLEAFSRFGYNKFFKGKRSEEFPLNEIYCNVKCINDVNIDINKSKMITRLIIK